MFAKYIEVQTFILDCPIIKFSLYDTVSGAALLRLYAAQIIMDSLLKNVNETGNR